MTNTRMSVDEREAFLANVYIGVLSIPCKEGAAPLTEPVWYDYEPGGEVWLITGSQSLKGQIGSKSYCQSNCRKCWIQLNGIGRNRITRCPHDSDNRKRSRRDNVRHEERSRFRRTHCRCPSQSAAGRRRRRVRFDSATGAHRYRLS